MPSAEPIPVTEPVHAEARIDATLADFGGDARAAIGALLLNRDEIMRDADRVISVGFLRGRFSAGARPGPIDDEP